MTTLEYFGRAVAAGLTVAALVVICAAGACFLGSALRQAIREARQERNKRREAEHMIRMVRSGKEGI